MKKLVTLLAAAGLVAAAAAPASAVDVKVDYRHRISFKSGSDDFAGTNLEEMKNRVRLGLTMAASENLKGYVQFQLLNGEQFGQISGTHGDNDATVRQMYIDWKIPSTPVTVRMGRQQMGLPADAFGENGVMAAGYGSRDGIVLTAPVADWLSLTALWSRTNYDGWTKTAAQNYIVTDVQGKELGKIPYAAAKKVNDLDKNSSDDIYAAVANLKFDGVSASVYAAYATLDGGVASYSNGGTLPAFEGDAYWLGFTSTWTFFDPFTLKLSAAFGEAAADDSEKGQKGWNVQAKAAYKTAYGTPVLGAWYFSGDDKDDLQYGGSMPNVQGAFTPTIAYHDGAKGLNGGLGMENPVGNWGIQAGIEGVSFIQGLTHDFKVSYIEGTNDAKWATDRATDGYYLTEDDAITVFDLSNTYKIYKNLSMHLELSYLISDFDNASARGLDEDAYNAELTFEYKF